MIDLRPHARGITGLMSLVAKVAIYLAAIQALRSGNSNDPATMWFQMISVPLLLVVLPCHVNAAVLRFTSQVRDA